MKEKELMYKIESFSIRKEKNDFLLFLNQTGKCYVINEVGKTIIESLNNQIGIQDLILNLGIEKNEIKAYLSLCKFIDFLKDEDILKISNQFELQTKLPRIEALENIHVKGKQCVTFGMPKRSCKSLPSAIVEKNKS